MFLVLSHIAPVGFEPTIYRLRGECTGRYATELRSVVWARMGSNHRRPPYERGALPLGPRTLSQWAAWDSNPEFTD